MHIILVTNESPTSHMKPSVSNYIIRRPVVNEPAATREAEDLTYIRMLSTTFAPKLTCQLAIAPISPKH